MFKFYFTLDYYLPLGKSFNQRIMSYSTIITLFHCDLIEKPSLKGSTNNHQSFKTGTMAH